MHTSRGIQYIYALRIYMRNTVVHVTYIRTETEQRREVYEGRWMTKAIRREAEDSGNREGGLRTRRAWEVRKKEEGRSSVVALGRLGTKDNNNRESDRSSRWRTGEEVSNKWDRF